MPDFPIHLLAAVSAPSPPVVLRRTTEAVAFLQRWRSTAPAAFAQPAGATRGNHDGVDAQQKPRCISTPFSRQEAC